MKQLFVVICYLFVGCATGSSICDQSHVGQFQCHEGNATLMQCITFYGEYAFVVKEPKCEVVQKCVCPNKDECVIDATWQLSCDPEGKSYKCVETQTCLESEADE